MRIEAVASNLYAGDRAQGPAADRSATALLSTAQIATETDGTKQVDFGGMTRQDMRDWVNTQLRSGQMTLEESQPFMAMTMKVPVGGGVGGELAAESDATRYDFVQKVRDGIQGALSRNDETTLKMLESALSIMQRQQGQAIGVSIRA